MKIDLEDLVRVNLGAGDHLVLCLPDSTDADTAEHLATQLAASPLAGRTTVVVGGHAHRIHTRRAVRRFLRRMGARP